MTKIDLQSVFKKQDNYLFAYIVFIVLFTAYYLFQLPVFAGDTDLWYHLNGGRYTLERLSVPINSFFSFMDPPREWVDYFWFFQVVVFKVYSFFGYYGLIFFRALAFLAIMIVIANYFLHKSHDKRPYLYTVILIPLYILLLLPRFQLVRPHILTYLFIAVFLYIIEFKKKKVIYLPVLAVIWMNVHGIAYPVMLLIILAYLVEFFVSRIRDKTHIGKNELYFIIPLILCIAAVYCTPHGSKLTWMPFTPTGFASLYIFELEPMRWDHFLTFQIKSMIGSTITVFNVLFVVSCLAAILLLFHKGRRLSHVLLFVGGTILLAKGMRFIYEFALLAIPIIKGGMVSVQYRSANSKSLKPVQTALLFLFIAATIHNIWSPFQNMPRFPFSHRNLPVGVVTFLKTIQTEGSILNHPNNGGYLQWMLYPRYKIFMDMEVPFLFTNEDMFLAVNIFRNSLFLNKVIALYNPAFITVSIKNQLFKELINDYPQYRIVFFDDSEVLYAHREQNPSIVSTYELKTLDPFRLAQSSINSIKALANVDPIREELLKVIAIYPDNGIANQCLAILYSKEGKYEKAIAHSENIIINYPESPTGYILKGDSLQDLKLYDKALENYELARKRQDVAEIHRKIGMVFYKQQKFREAYDTLVRAMDVYSVETTYKDLYYLIDSAIKTGKKREAEILFRYAYQSIPPPEGEWLKRYRELGVIME